MYPPISNDIPQLADQEWLKGEFKTKSVRQVARELGIRHTTLRGYVVRYGIDLAVLRNGKTPGLSQPGHPSTLKKVITREDVLREYIEKDVSMTEAAQALGCSIRPFFLAMKELGIASKPRGKRPQQHCGIEQLADPQWLEEQLATKPMSQIAQELGTSNGNVSDHVKRYGLRDLHYDRSVAVREGLKKRFPNGRRGEAASNWQGGRKKTSGGYVYIYAPEHPNATKAGYVLEHRLAAEKALGHIIDPDKHVHHKYGDIQDFSAEHLEVLTHAEHTRAHFDAVKEVYRLQQIVDRYEALYGPLSPEPC